VLKSPLWLAPVVYLAPLKPIKNGKNGDERMGAQHGTVNDGRRWITPADANICHTFMI
jgi:hypothetical protein